MADIKISPPSWELVEQTEHHGYYVQSDAGLTVCDLYAMGTTVDCRPTPIPFPDAKANGRLISAAPDLLAALQSVMWMAEEWFKYSGCDATCADEYRRDLDRADAVLAKAGAQ